MQSFDSRRCHVCQSYRDFIRFSSSSNAPLAAILSRLAFSLGDLIPSPMFVSIFVQYALWLKIIGHHKKHLGKSSNMYEIRQGSLLHILPKGSMMTGRRIFYAPTTGCSPSFRNCCIHRHVTMPQGQVKGIDPAVVWPVSPHTLGHPTICFWH